MYKISVIIPVYNVENYLAKCLESVVNQTLRDIQIIVVNDGSTDNTALIARKYHDLYPARFVYIEKENSGQGGARNVGLAYAAGEYIGFVDGDDYVEPDMYEQMYSLAKKDNFDMVECDYFHTYTRREKLKLVPHYTLDTMLVSTKYALWNKIMKRSIIEKNKLLFPDRLIYEDFEFVCRIVPYITKIGFIQRPLYHYIQREGSTCHIKTDKIKDIFTVLENIFSYYRKNNWYDTYRTRLEYICTQTVLGGHFFRVVKIDDKRIRKTLLREAWIYLNDAFPQWRKNSILQKSKSKLDWYIKTVNRVTYRVYGILFGAIK